jgi:hypothetical protein
MRSWLTFVLVVALVTASCTHRNPGGAHVVPRPVVTSDSMLLDVVQRQTFRYFWDYAHPVSGMTRERSDRSGGYGDEVVAVGGTGFGTMAVILATERGWIGRDTAAAFLLKLVRFLMASQSHHGAFPHWMDGAIGATIPFGDDDDGADIVETAYLFEGLLCVRQYFDGKDNAETELRAGINHLWRAVEWNWFTRGSRDTLYWHWSPRVGWKMNMPIRGFNETMITYVLAASSPTFPVDTIAYHRCWASGSDFRNGKSFYGIPLPLGPDFGGPLFFTHYSFMGLDPRGLKDRYGDYWERNRNHVLINREHCIRNPYRHTGYSDSCWGLTASDSYNDYVAHSPTEDNGTITPSAALGSFPYAPAEAMQALRYFYDRRGDKIWTAYGFADAFNDSKGWVAPGHIAIDQGPIIVMIENHRSGLLWRLFMSSPEVRSGLRRLGFTSPWLAATAAGPRVNGSQRQIGSPSVH